eukprot:TRINITY_DN30704_c0_g1_i1.p1 TRINITY_DN30704_c0_g1~~TRINITY_DN30704_c0_g1_i1.p1  ORF type:complete len:402 (+),score=75.46 TRINITY_DN30704_c0_g1_i1:57-1208(+)
MAKISDFEEILPLLENERPDVRKQVLKVMSGFLQHDNIIEYTIEHGSQSVKMITEMIQPGDAFKTYLSDVLLVLINLSDKGALARAMLDVRVVPRTMLLLEKGSLSSGLQELCLILIANLTSVTVEAVEHLLQTNNKVLEGYYLSQLIRRFVDEHGDASNLLVKPSEADGFVGGGRDRSKWVGSILGNCAQCEAGRKLLIDDDESLKKFADLLSTEDTQLRLAVACLIKNILHDPDTHPALLQQEIGGALMTRIIGSEKEKNEEILNVIVHAVKCLSLSKPGVDFLDGVGAKGELRGVVESVPDAIKPELQKIIDGLDDVQEIIQMEEPEPKNEEQKNKKKQKPIPAESGVEELDSDDDGEEIELAALDDDELEAEKDMEDVE